MYIRRSFTISTERQSLNPTITCQLLEISPVRAASWAFESHPNAFATAIYDNPHSIALHSRSQLLIVDSFMLEHSRCAYTGAWLLR